MLLGRVRAEALPAISSHRWTRMAFPTPTGNSFGRALRPLPATRAGASSLCASPSRAVTLPARWQRRTGAAPARPPLPQGGRLGSDEHHGIGPGNDTGGAICQLVIAHHPERISRLVLINCDAFEQFFPPLVSPFHYEAQVFGIHFANFLAWVLRARSAQRLFVAALSHRRLDLAELDAALHPLLHLPGVRSDMTRFLQAVSNRYTLEAARTFSGFHHPVLLVWGKDDPFFSGRLARRLQQAFPDATLEFLSHSRAFVPLDQPEVLAQQITEFVHAEDVA